MPEARRGKETESRAKLEETVQKEGSSSVTGVGAAAALLNDRAVGNRDGKAG